MRFYFNIRDNLPIDDEIGREFARASDAVIFAKYLAADLRCLEPDERPQLAIHVVDANARRIHEERVFS
jgi:hypothetical protein